MYAPICIFVYNRPAETERMLSSLAMCPEAKESWLYIFSDGAKGETDIEPVNKVRNICSNENRFSEVKLFSSKSNKGLSRSIIDGVSKVLEEYDSVIVLEDDLMVSVDFLSFINNALRIYKSRSDIWSISGYTPNISIPQNYTSDIFLVQRPQCWGWATWCNRWNTVDWSTKAFPLLKDRTLRLDFNKGGNDLYRTLDMQQQGIMDVWAIRWVFSAWLQHTWTINPRYSKVCNMGFTNTATHRGWHDKRHAVEISDHPIMLDYNIQPSEDIIKAFKSHHDLNFISKIGYFLRRYNMGYEFLKQIMNK